MQTPFVSISLVRLRRGVTMCCWIVGLALVTQLLVWCFATFMDVRYQVLEDRTPGALIVSPGDASRNTVATPGAEVVSESEVDPNAVNPNRVTTKHDQIMAHAERFAYGFGIVGIVMLVPMLALGAVLAAGSATPGVEKTVSAFMWAVVLAVLILPMGEVLGLPWREGALVSYENMTKMVDAEIGDSNDSWGTPTFYARFAVLPLAALVGITIVGMGFSAGVHAGVIREDTRLDPVLEREAANVTPSSLHGGRAAVALRAASTAAVAATERKPMPVAATATSAPPAPPSITQLSPGEAPKRLI
jgi:hypothetical protein